MDMDGFFGRNIFEVLQELRLCSSLVTYEKIEGSEFLELPEDGFYLQAKNGEGVISDFRIFLEKSGKYFPAKQDILGRYSGLTSYEDFKKRFGAAKRDVNAVLISGAEPTLPGKVFEDDGKKIIAYSSEGESVAYLHVKLIV